MALLGTGCTEFVRLSPEVVQTLGDGPAARVTMLAGSGAGRRLREACHTDVDLPAPGVGGVRSYILRLPPSRARFLYVLAVSVAYDVEMMASRTSRSMVVKSFT